MKTAEQRAQAWLDDPAYDEKTKAAVRELLKHPEKLTDAFFTDLSFGTGGLRGIMGVGTNRMNIYTIRKTTQGLANYIKKNGTPSKGVIIGFDSRHHSVEFAQETAKVLAGNGIKVYLLPELRPTPFVSFSVRHLKTQAGVMITASHNPKEYNGYKVYWQDGGQVVPPHDTGIITQVDAISSQGEVKLSSLNDPLITTPDKSLDEAYLKAIAALQFFPKENHHSLKISYTSLHGTGITLMIDALERWGFSPPHLVASQIVPDGNFPTVHFPNPEYPEALKAGIEDLVFAGSDMLLATDPDADRLGVVVQHHGKPVTITGNELAAIGAYFVCDSLSNQKKLPPNGAIVTTIVTTELLKSIAAAYKVACFEVLTGFKYIGEKIHEWELKPTHQFLFGAEESYGYLIGTHARDKDGIAAGCLFAEVAFRMKEHGKTLVDLLHEIYTKFGIFREKQFSLTFEEGKKGLDAIHKLMNNLRQSTPTMMAGKKVVAMEDLLKASHLPKSDVLIFRLEDESKVIIRPSGTEPKLKVYLATKTTGFSSVQDGIADCDSRLDQLIFSLKKELNT
jgi:phosphomannomutase